MTPADDVRDEQRSSRSRGSSSRRSSSRDTESRAEKKNRTRQALLDTTMDLVAQRSFASLSLREVARGAGIVPTAFYRHFSSMEDLGVTLVEDSMRVLRRALREGRRNLASRNALPTATNSLEILLDHVRDNEAQFRFLVREQHGGVAEIRRAIDTELRLFGKELAIDLARLPDMGAWSPDDLELAAGLIVNVMLAAVADLLDGEYRGAVVESEVIERAKRQLVLVFLGMSRWDPERSG
ncbi:TetR family transcriptional regulator [Gordonia crocea]|uniref:TetR family transcriptional regulator n=1 Tax=Gordonia crocea TaxID=589162 RepID=UPI00137A9339